MATFSDVRGGKQYRMMYVTLEGREYWVTMTSLGPFHDQPPLVCFETAEGFVEAVSENMTYSDLQELAVEHGCILGDMVSVEPVN